MALRYIEGFDHENASADLVGGGVVTPIAPYTNPPALPTVALSSAGTRWGVGNLLAVSGLGSNQAGFTIQPNGLLLASAGTLAEGFVGVAALPTGSAPPSNEGWALGFYDGVAGTWQCSARFRADGTVEIWNGQSLGGGTLLGSVPNAYNWSEWAYVEFGATIGSGTAGSATVRINGATVLTVSGVNTQATANASFTAACLIAGVGNAYIGLNIDDVYFCDASGASGNTFLGDCRVLTGFPDAAGAKTQWIPLANANWQEVSEVAMDSDTTFNATSTAGAADLFPTGIAIPATATVFGVQATVAARKYDAATHTLSPLVQSNGVEGTGAAATLGSTYGYIKSMFEVDPNTAEAWTVAAAEAAQVGYELVS